MAWFKVDDHFWSHPKTANLSDGATALWLRAGSWSAGHLTDGFVPDSALRFFRTRRRSAAELVDAGLWSAVEGGFLFHDWAEYQPSKEQVTAKREATRARVTAHRQGKGNAVTDSGAAGKGNAAPVPSRPDPITKDISSEVADATPRPELDALLDLLDSLIIANGGKATGHNKRNRDAARLMLDVDGHTVEQIERAIRWSQGDEFWRANILSMSKLREKYDQLRLSAMRTVKPSKEDQFFDVLQMGRELQEEADRRAISS